MRNFFNAVFFSSLCATCWAGPSFSSGPQRVSLLELYTSEGCSSCPPAEKWLSGLMENSGLWKQFVPVAFHVTYWDHLGWKDATGQESANERQRAIASHWGTATVYTPCFVLDGAEWRAGGSMPKSAKEAGVLEITRRDDGSVAVLFSPMAKKTGYRARVAILGSGIQTKVQRGENAGRMLEHDFVVLSQGSAELKPSADGKLEAVISLPKSAAPAPRLALAAWVEMKDSTTPVQATGGWLK